MAKFCSECGSPLDEGVKFCTECGAPVPAAQTEKQKPENKTEAFAAKKTETKTPPTEKKEENRTKSDKKGGTKFLSLFLAVIMIVELGIAGFKYPGWFTKKGNDPDAHVSQNAETAAFDAQTFSAKTTSGVSVELNEYVYEPDMLLNVEPKKAVYAENGDYVITPYEIDIGGVHELDDFVTVRIPFDGSFCDQGEDPAECVGAVYLNKTTGEWEDVLYTVDKENSELVITTDHFSEYGAFKVKNAGLRNAYLTDNALFIPGLSDESKALAVMSEYVDSAGQETKTAKLMGSEAVMASLSLMNAAGDTTDAVGNVFSVATYLDGIDLAMKGDWNSLQIFDRVNTEFIKSKPPAKELFYNNGFAEKTSDVLSKVGLAISAVKLTYAFGQAAMGNASYADKLNLYKDTINMAISLSGNATLGALMLPVFIADKFIGTLFSEAFEIKDAQIEEEYEYFNRKFEGSSDPALRAGRGAKDWRKVIIDLIRDNPDADADKLIEEEIDTFANDFWRLDAEELAWFSSSLPQNVKRIPDTTASEREAITKAYKAQLYKELVPVMQSVRLYFEQKAELDMIKKINEAKRLYNSRIGIRLTEALPEGETSLYAGCKARLMPLSTLANKDSWTFALNENGSVSASCTYLGYLQAGCPYAVCVYGKDDDPDTAEPILTVRTGINGSGIHVVLEHTGEPEETTADVSNAFPLEADLYITRSVTAVYKTGSDLYKNALEQCGKTAHISIDENGHYILTVPDMSGVSHQHDSGMATYTHTSLELQGFSVEGQFDSTELSNGKFQADLYNTLLSVSPTVRHYKGEMSIVENWGGGDIRNIGPAPVYGWMARNDSDEQKDRMIISYSPAEKRIEIDLEYLVTMEQDYDQKVKDGGDFIEHYEMTNQKPE